MKVIKENHGEAVVLTLKGEFDSFVTGPFNDEVQKEFDAGVHQLVLNMRLVKFVNSTALGAMIRARKAAKAGGGDLVVSQPSQAVREAMEALGLDKLFRFLDSDDAALASFDS